MLDMIRPTRWRGVALAVYYTVPSLGASLGPLVGGFLVHAGGGWRWTFLSAAFSAPLLGGVALVMAPIPWCFWIYGERIRKRSRHETSI
ncbi:general substrate transporter [Cordyceps militaris CM01]|uniref:General substrate transporter n=1 Tax=Cordyceps militaris (strain CM01) TaxID=983644 RepID=G3JCE8_CORMM|nr:general substrate transporter [Cordyceps militaris CM01]EGX94609.1 general substrate transporter [Cordyceps militaris CM01]